MIRETVEEEEEELEYLRLDLRLPKTSAARRPAAVEMSIFITFNALRIKDRDKWYVFCCKKQKVKKHIKERLRQKSETYCVRLRQKLSCWWCGD